MIFGGPRLNTVFASRWKALWWAGAVLLTAYCSVPNKGEDDPVAALVKLAVPAAPPTQAPPHHVDPWAKDAPQAAA